MSIYSSFYGNDITTTLSMSSTPANVFMSTNSPTAPYSFQSAISPVGNFTQLGNFPNFQSSNSNNNNNNNNSHNYNNNNSNNYNNYNNNNNNNNDNSNVINGYPFEYSQLPIIGSIGSLTPTTTHLINQHCSNNSHDTSSVELSVSSSHSTLCNNNDNNMMMPIPPSTRLQTVTISDRIHMSDDMDDENMSNGDNKNNGKKRKCGKNNGNNNKKGRKGTTKSKKKNNKNSDNTSSSSSSSSNSNNNGNNNNNTGCTFSGGIVSTANIYENRNRSVMEQTIIMREAKSYEKDIIDRRKNALIDTINTATRFLCPSSAVPTFDFEFSSETICEFLNNLDTYSFMQPAGCEKSIKDWFKAGKSKWMPPIFVEAFCAMDNYAITVASNAHVPIRRVVAQFYCALFDARFDGPDPKGKGKLLLTRGVFNPRRNNVVTIHLENVAKEHFADKYKTHKEKHDKKCSKKPHYKLPFWKALFEDVRSESKDELPCIPSLPIGNTSTNTNGTIKEQRSEDSVMRQGSNSVNSSPQSHHSLMSGSGSGSGHNGINSSPESQATINLTNSPAMTASTALSGSSQASGASGASGISGISGMSRNGSQSGERSSLSAMQLPPRDLSQAPISFVNGGMDDELRSIKCELTFGDASDLRLNIHSISNCSMKGNEKVNNNNVLFSTESKTSSKLRNLILGDSKNNRYDGSRSRSNTNNGNNNNNNNNHHTNNNNNNNNNNNGIPRFHPNLNNLGNLPKLPFGSTQQQQQQQGQLQLQFQEFSNIPNIQSIEEISLQQQVLAPPPLQAENGELQRQCESQLSSLFSKPLSQLQFSQLSPTTTTISSFPNAFPDTGINSYIYNNNNNSNNNLPSVISGNFSRHLCFDEVSFFNGNNNGNNNCNNGNSGNMFGSVPPLSNPINPNSFASNLFNDNHSYNQTQ